MDLLTVDSLPAIATLCRRSVWASAGEEELGAALFPGDQDVVVIGDPGAGIVAVVREPQQGWIRLLVVHPNHRRHGVGRALLAAGEAALAGVETVAAGGDPSRALFPGVTVTDLALCCTLEACSYQRSGTVVNMEFDLKVPLAPDVPGWALADEDVLRALGGLCLDVAPAAAAELLRALAVGSLLVVRDGKSLAGACGLDVNRGGTIGPLVARHEEAVRRLLAGAVRVLRERGHPRAEWAAVSALRPAADLGAKVGRLSHIYTKDLGSS